MNRRGRTGLLAAAFALSAVLVASGGVAQHVAVVAAIVVAFVVAVRRGFSLVDATAKHGAGWTGAWVAAIAVLLGFELWQLVNHSVTATALVVPLLAVPVVRALTLAAWLRIGWALFG